MSISSSLKALVTYDFCWREQKKRKSPLFDRRMGLVSVGKLKLDQRLWEGILMKELSKLFFNYVQDSLTSRHFRDDKNSNQTRVVTKHMVVINDYVDQSF